MAEPMSIYLVFMLSEYVQGHPAFWLLQSQMTSMKEVYAALDKYGVDRVFFVRVEHGVPPKRTARELEREMNRGSSGYAVYRGWMGGEKQTDVEPPNSSDPNDDLYMCIS